MTTELCKISIAHYLYGKSVLLTQLINKKCFRFKHSLMTWGDKFSGQECDEAFSEFLIEDGQIDAAHLKGLMVAKKEEEA